MQSKNQIQNQINNELSGKVTYYFQQLQSEFDRIHSVMELLSLDEDLYNLILDTNSSLTYSQVSAINRLRNRLTSLKESDQYVQIASIYLPTLKIKINSGGTNVSYDDFDKRLEQSLDTYNRQNGYISIRNNQIYLFYNPSSLLSSPEPSFLIEVQLDNDYLQKSLLQNDIYLNSLSFLVLPNDSYCISNQSSADGQKLLDYLQENPDAPKRGILSTLSLPDKYIYNESYFENLQAYYIQLIPQSNALRGMDNFKVWLVIYSALSILFVFIFYFITYRLIKKPIDKMIQAFKKVQKKDFSIRIDHPARDEFHYLYGAFNETIKETQNLISQVYMQKILTQRADLRQLQAQINPHFLYNSFFILQGRIKKRDFESADRFCEMLGIYFQYITKSNADSVPLVQEVKHARIYTEIQKIRFKSRITVIFGELSSFYENKHVPKLILQPILENAFKYGLEERERDGMLRVSFNDRSGYLVIYVEDNGTFFHDGEQKLIEMRRLFDHYEDINEPSGLINIHKRIKISLGEDSGISFERSELGGLGVKLVLSFGESGKCIQS